MDAYLVKPLEPERLIEIVASIGKKSTATDPTTWGALEKRDRLGHIHLRRYVSVFLADASLRLEGINQAALTSNGFERLEHDAHTLLNGAREFGA